jgi:adenine specific DNA methylase Mod
MFYVFIKIFYYLKEVYGFIDDKNMHYLKIIADKIFGYENYIATIIWQHRTTRENRSNIFK